MTKAKETVEVKSSFGIVNFILKRLGLGDTGILDKFYTKEIKIAKRNIKILKGNKEASKINYETDKDKLKDDLEDAKERLLEAYVVKPENIKNNTAMESFRIDYWYNIHERKNIIQDLSEELEVLANTYKNTIKSIDIEIKEIEESITLIKDFV